MSQPSSFNSFQASERMHSASSNDISSPQKRERSDSSHSDDAPSSAKVRRVAHASMERTQERSPTNLRTSFSHIRNLFAAERPQSDTPVCSLPPAVTPHASTATPHPSPESIEFEGSARALFFPVFEGVERNSQHSPQSFSTSGEAATAASSRAATTEDPSPPSTPPRRIQTDHFDPLPASPETLPGKAAKQPPAPVKMNRRMQNPDNLYRRAFDQAECNHAFVRDDENRLQRLHIENFLAAGDYKNVYSLRDQNNRVLKCYSESTLHRTTDRSLSAWTKHAMGQYERVAATDYLRAARILNNPMEDGVFLCERFDTKWEDAHLWKDDASRTFASLPCDVRMRLEEFRGFFTWAALHDEPLDLKEDNFGIDPASGEIVLLDFLEEEEDESFAPLNTHLRRISGSNNEIKEFLIAPLKELNPELYERFSRGSIVN